MTKQLFFPTNESNNQINKDEIWELARRIDVDAALNFFFTTRKSKILRYAAEIADINKDSSLKPEEKAAQLSDALERYVEVLSLDPDEVDSELADEGLDPALSLAASTLYALLANAYVEEALTNALEHPQKSFPMMMYAKNPNIVLFKTSRKHFEVFIECGTYTVEARTDDAAVEQIEALATEDVVQEMHIVSLEDARGDVQFGMESWEDYFGVSWEEAHQDFQAKETTYLDA